MLEKGFLRFEVTGTTKKELPKTFYLKHEGSRTWIVPTNGDASEIYCQSPPCQGFGGRTLNFRLEDGSMHAARGPWHRNSDDLYKATGIDLRQNHKTLGIVALESKPVDHHGMTTDYRGVLHIDEREIVGDFDRIPKLAQKIANEQGKEVWYQVITAGGGQKGRKNPEES